MAAPTESKRQAYRAASWVTGALAFVAAVLTFGFGLAAVVGPAPAEEDDRVTTGPAPTREVIQVLAPDQSVVSGTLTKVVGTKVEGAPPLVVPLTMTVGRGGGVKAEFSGGAIGGKKATITWDGGRPLPLRGEGSIDLNGPVSFDVTSKGASWALDGGTRLLTPGSYSFGSTVAVSQAGGGFGSAKDGARLDVPAGASASINTEGGVRVATAAAPLKLRGPGQLVLEGSLEVETRDGVRPARKVTFGPGAFELDILPEAGGYRIERAFLQGPTTVEG